MRDPSLTETDRHAVDATYRENISTIISNIQYMLRIIVISDIGISV